MNPIGNTPHDSELDDFLDWFAGFHSCGIALHFEEAKQSLLALIGRREEEAEIRGRKDEMFKVRLDGSVLNIKDWIISRRERLEKQLAELQKARKDQEDAK